MSRRGATSPSSGRTAEAEFERVYKDHYRKVYGLAYRMLGTAEDAADAAQETFIRVHRGLPGFEGRSSLSTWIYSITANVCRNFLAKRKNATVLVPEIADRPDPAPDFATRVQDQAVLGNALLGIPHDLRICVLLSDLIGFSYEQIAQALSIPVGTVKSRIFRARKGLIDVLKGQAISSGTARDAPGSSSEGASADAAGSRREGTSTDTTGS